MAKQGMRRYNPDDFRGGKKHYDNSKKNEAEPVMEIKGKAKSGKEKAKPI